MCHTPWECHSAFGVHSGVLNTSRWPSTPLLASHPCAPLSPLLPRGTPTLYLISHWTVPLTSRHLPESQFLLLDVYRRTASEGLSSLPGGCFFPLLREDRRRGREGHLQEQPRWARRHTASPLRPSQLVAMVLPSFLKAPALKNKVDGRLWLEGFVFSDSITTILRKDGPPCRGRSQPWT